MNKFQAGDVYKTSISLFIILYVEEDGIWLYGTTNDGSHFNATKLSYFEPIWKTLKEAWKKI